MGDGTTVAEQSVDQDTETLNRPADRSSATVLREFAANSHPIDTAFIFLVSLPLLLGFLIPDAMKVDLVLRYLDPRPLTVYTSHFVHFSSTHLLSNLVGYLVLAGIGYVFAILSERRIQFLSFFVISLTVLPESISALNIVLVRPRVGFGFSAIVMGFLGFLPIMLTAFLRDRFSLYFDIDFAPVFFLAGLGIIAVQVVPDPTKFAVLVPIALLLALYVFGLVEDVFLSGRVRRFKRDFRDDEAALLVVGVVVFATMPFIAFPADPVTNGTITNLYSHLLGYALGFIAPYVTFRILT